MATPVGAVFLVEGIVLCSTRFLRVKTLFRFSDGRCLRFDALFPPWRLRLEDPALRCLWSVHRKSEFLALMSYVLLQLCRRKFFLCSPCGFCPVSPLNRAYVRFLGPVSPQNLGQVSSSLMKTGSPCPLLMFFLKKNNCSKIETLPDQISWKSGFLVVLCCAPYPTA